ncbi:MAG: MarR family winged helix-turn-helix transcriptional regulator [Propionibacteriaceae bacterium]|nr:MarR family winged helix-turn-helix transcriptional regulator [Propionibacteriaceae bacterium]
MRAATLHQLGRRLSGIAGTMTHPDAGKGTPLGELAILDDLLLYGRSAVRDITQRTGFAQSHVSSTLAKLAEEGEVRWEKNPKDARSRWADLTPKARTRLEAGAATRVEDALAADLGPRDAEKLVKLLSRAAKILEVKKPSALR